MKVDIEDRSDIQDLIARYAEAVDDGDVDKLASLFSDGCVFRAIQGDNGVAHNRAEVKQIAQRIFSIFDRTSHHVSNIRLVADGPDRVRGITYLYAWHRFIEERPDGILWGRYHDVFERRDGVWLFSERVLRVTAEENFPMRWVEPLPGSLDS